MLLRETRVGYPPRELYFLEYITWYLIDYIEYLTTTYYYTYYIQNCERLEEATLRDLNDSEYRELLTKPY